MKLIFIMFVCFFILGCASTASYQRATAGKIGCAPDEIQITKYGNDVWAATCKGKKFICSIAIKDSHDNTDFTCTPEIK